MSNTAIAKAAAAAPVVPATPTARPTKYAESDVITLLVDKNPKRAASAKRFACYKTGITVGAYLDACEKIQPDEPRHRWRADLAWDVARKFISIAPAK